jgi:hypothetical protein
MLADAGTSMSDAGTGYNMRGNKAIAADVNGVAPAQAPQRGSRAIASDFGSTQAPQAAPQAAGLNPAAAQAVVPQSRAGLMGMIEQELQQLQAKRQQLDAIQPQGKAGVIRKAAELKQLENEERWIYGKAVEAQRQKEQAAKDAATRASADGRDALALRNEQARIAHDKATLDQHKVTNDRTQKNDDRAAADKWASSIKEVAEADGRFQTRDNANSQEQGEHGINPRKANTLRQTMVAHYGEMVPDGKGGITPAFKDGNKDVADITTKMGTFSKKYDQALTDLQKKFPNEDPAKLESLIDHNTIFKMIDRDVDLANKAAAAQQKAAAEQAAPPAAPAPAPVATGLGLDPQAVPEAAPTGLGLNPQAAAPDLAGQYVNAGDAARVPSPPRVPSMSEVEMALTDARNKPTWTGAKWVGEQLGKIQPTTETQDFSLSGDSPAVQRPDVAVTSPFKRADESAQILNRYQSGTPEERAVIEELYPQIKDFSSTALGEGPM